MLTFFHFLSETRAVIKNILFNKLKNQKIKTTDGSKLLLNRKVQVKEGKHQALLLQ